MQKEKLVPYLMNKVRQVKTYSGDKLKTRLNRIEKIISIERLNGNINNEQLEELMMAGYVGALRKRLEEFIDEKGVDYLSRTQTLPDPNYNTPKNVRIIKEDSELGKACNKIADTLKIMLGYKDNKK